MEIGMKYIGKLIETFNSPSFPVFTINDVKLLFTGTSMTDGYLHLMMHNLLKKRKITRITRGVYTCHNNEALVAGFAFSPFYFGLEHALRIHKFSLQVTNPLVITSRNVRNGVKHFSGRNYVVYKLPAKYLFGYALKNYADMWIPVSDIEKTVIDMIYFKIAIRDEIWPKLLKEINTQKLKNYLKNYNPRFRSKVINIIAISKARNIANIRELEKSRV